MPTDSLPPWSNPFSTRYVRPGAIRFSFAGREDFRCVEQVVDRLAANHWRGQLVGPHGAGKSALLADLVAMLREQGQRLHEFALRKGERQPAGLWSALAASLPGDLFVLDGFEQLRALDRWRFRRQTHRRQVGLLITAHRELGLPTLMRLSPTTDLAWKLARQRAAAAGVSLAQAEVEAAFHRQRGNLRETWFELYDLLERRRTSGRKHE